MWSAPHWLLAKQAEVVLGQLLIFIYVKSMLKTHTYGTIFHVIQWNENLRKIWMDQEIFF